MFKIFIRLSVSVRSQSLYISPFRSGMFATFLVTVHQEPSRVPWEPFEREVEGVEWESWRSTWLYKERNVNRQDAQRNCYEGKVWGCVKFKSALELPSLTGAGKFPSLHYHCFPWYAWYVMILVVHVRRLSRFPCWPLAFLVLTEHGVLELPSFLQSRRFHLCCGMSVIHDHSLCLYGAGADLF